MIFPDDYVDVIVPLSVPNLFTYLVPSNLSTEIEVGKRVVVQFGRSRYYTAVIANIHKTAPENYQAKEIQSVIDDFPVVNLFQLKLWKWISQYYCCTIGEVMNAALPNGYKLVSETKITLGDGTFDAKNLSDDEFIVVEALELQPSLSVAEVSKILNIKSVHRIIKSLLEKDVIYLEEELKEKFKPQLKTYITLNKEFVFDENSLLNTFESLKKFQKQEDVLMSFTGRKEFNFEDFKLEKKVLLEPESISPSALSTLIKKNIFHSEKKEVTRITNDFDPNYSFQLSADQEQAKTTIDQGFSSNKIVLLDGITGSGKTEVYLKLIEEQLVQKKQVLYLLPEIALTTQLINRLKLMFGGKVGVYHSRFSQNERMEIWAELLKDNSKFDIIIGARSSVFLPFKNLGLVIVDEEHETSFKQYDPAPRYNGRDVGIYLAKMHKAQCILGTATPSIETYFNAQTDKYQLVQLKNRFNGSVLPEIQCADVQDDRKKKKMTGIFTKLLKTEIEAALKNKEQIILFQSRRGFAPILECNVCGNTEQCERCDVSLTFHKGVNQLRCHYCGHSQKVDITCSSCGSVETGFKGFGTEMIMENFQEVFPGAKVARMDYDTTRGKTSYQTLISDFSEGKIDVLIGTQMVTKGLDFANVSLVGVLNADQMLNFPDFRAFERAYQMLTQVSGRAGRRKKRGKVIVQTYTPYHSVIRNVMENNYSELYQSEILARKNFNYPPFYKLINITLKHPNKSLLDSCAEGFGIALKGELTEERVLGPEYPAISRINKFYQKSILIKFEREVSAKQIKEILNKWIATYKKEKAFSSIRFNVDVDPI